MESDVFFPITITWNNRAQTCLIVVGSDGKVYACNTGDPGSIPGWGRSPGGGNGNPLHILAWRVPWTVESAGL